MRYKLLTLQSQANSYSEPLSPLSRGELCMILQLPQEWEGLGVDIRNKEISLSKNGTDRWLKCLTVEKELNEMDYRDPWLQGILW